MALSNVLRCDDHHDSSREMFGQHIAEFGLSYGTKQEYEYRYQIWLEKDKLIRAHNISQSSYKMAHNKFSTLAPHETKGKLRTSTPFEASNVSRPLDK